MESEDDPALLAELEAIIAAEPSSQETVCGLQHTRKDKIYVASQSENGVNFVQGIDNIPSHYTNENLDFKEDDMSDPHLLAELARIVEIAQQLETAVTSPLLVTHEQVSATVTSEIIIESLELNVDDQLKDTNIDALKKYIQQEKIKAVNYKRSGDKIAAFGCLRSLKLLAARLSKLDQTTEEIRHVSGQRKIENQVAFGRPLGGNVELVNTSNQCQNELRSIDQLDANLKSSITTPANLRKVIMKSVSSSDCDFADSSQKVRACDKFQVIPEFSKEGSVEVWNFMRKTLDENIEQLTKIALHYFSTKQKPLALEYHKRKKQLVSDLAAIESLKVAFLGGLTPISFQFEEYEYDESMINSQIELDEILIQIVECQSVASKTFKGEQLNCKINFDLGWPKDSKTEETHAMKGTNPRFDYSKCFKIERTKLFQRFLERKKILFQVIHTVPGIFGYFLGLTNTVIGKTVVSLDDLLRKCDIAQVYDIMDPINPRRPTGGKIEVIISLKQPLLQHQIVKKTGKWINIRFGGAFERFESQKTPKLSFTSKVVDAVANDIEDNDLESSFNNADNVASHDVLEKELNEIVAQIASLKVSMKPVPAELLFLQNTYQLRIDLFIAMIQAGSLNMPTYIDQVKKYVSEIKIMAVSFKKHGRMDLAKRAIGRLKIMERELTNAEGDHL